MFHECFNEITKEVFRPRAWGEKVDQSIKDELLNGGWHTRVCPKDDEEQPDEPSEKTFGMENEVSCPLRRRYTESPRPHVAGQVSMLYQLRSSRSA